MLFRSIVILTMSPELIHEVGFQLSVAATAGIVLGAQPLEAWCRPMLEKVLPNFWATMLSSSFAISATAQLACQPLLLTFIDYVSPYSLLANLLATPLLPMITIPGTVAAGLGWHSATPAARCVTAYGRHRLDRHQCYQLAWSNASLA